MRSALVLVCVLGCGRVRFDITRGDGAADNDGQTMLRCGDGTCSGTAGELCTTCMADCMTLAPVCGNGACDAGESSLECYADCGPTPWQWTANEQVVLTMINDARVNGTQCPGGGGVITAPALTSDAAMQLAAREWAWERVHQGYTGPDAGCNGRSLGDRLSPVNAGAAWIMDASTATDAVTFILANQAACPSVLNAAYAAIGVGAADDIAPFPAFIVLLR